MHSQSIAIEIDKYRDDPSRRCWDLPPWGHPLSQGVLPLFITFEDRLFPIGTAFTIGHGVTFIVSAAHNIHEAWKYEARLRHLLHARDLPQNIKLKQAGISVLHHQPNGRGGISITIWPLETVEGAPPTDVVIGFPQFQTQFATLTNRLSFDLPPIGERLWSIGYCEFQFPEGGIPFAAVQNGTFDWENDYHHTLRVVEGFVERIFTQRFAAGFIEGPCFTFDAEIAHAQSGGPILSPEGVVRGVNSAGAETFFNRPVSIGSLLYPLLFTQLRLGVQMGPVRINASQPLASLVAQGTIPTDGSEERVGIGRADDGSLYAKPRSPSDMGAYIHDDFAGYQDGRKATTDAGPAFRLRRLKTEEPSSSGQALSNEEP